MTRIRAERVQFEIRDEYIKRAAQGAAFPISLDLIFGCFASGQVDFQGGQ